MQWFSWDMFVGRFTNGRFLQLELLISYIADEIVEMESLKCPNQTLSWLFYFFRYVIVFFLCYAVRIPVTHRHTQVQLC
jgi:hypothetical protein